MNSSKLARWAKRGAIAGLALGLSLVAGGASARAAASGTTAGASAAFEEVDSFLVLTRPYSWQAIDDHTVIVWATPFKPYLLELAYPSPDLKFALVIGVTSVGNRVYSRFDAVRVAGFRYPIDSIYKLTRDEARNLVRES